MAKKIQFFLDYTFSTDWTEFYQLSLNLIDVKMLNQLLEKD